MNAQASDAELRAEADGLLASGVAAALAEYGFFEPIGSYALRLMVWRDLDLEVVPPTLDLEAFLELGSRLGAVLRPVRMSFRDELRLGTPHLPRGFYWGFYLGAGDAGGWKVDVWAVDEAEKARRVERMSSLEARLTERARAAILGIKARVWALPGYRKEFTSLDVYSAVLDDGVVDADEFLGWLRDRSVAV